MKFCRVSHFAATSADDQPIFRLLNTQDHDLAIKTFTAHANFYVSPGAT